MVNFGRPNNLFSVLRAPEIAVRSFMKALPLALFALSTTLVGCGNGTSTSSAPASVTPEGNCTSLYVSDYNKVVSESKLTTTYLRGTYYSESSKRSQVQSLVSACSQLNSVHGTVSCTALIDGQSINVSSATVKPACDAANSYLAYGMQAPDPTPAPIQQPDDFSDMSAYRIKFNVNNSYELKRLLLDRELMMINGRVANRYEVRRELRTGAAMCAFSGPTGNEIYGLDLSLPLRGLRLERTGQIFTLSLKNDRGDYFALVCTKLEGRVTMRDVREATGSIMDLRID